MAVRFELPQKEVEDAWRKQRLASPVPRAPYKCDRSPLQQGGAIHDAHPVQLELLDDVGLLPPPGRQAGRAGQELEGEDHLPHG